MSKKSSKIDTKKIIVAIIIVLAEAFIMAYCLKFFGIYAPYINSLCFVLVLHVVLFVLKFLHIIKG